MMSTTTTKSLGEIEAERVYAACGVTIDTQPAARSELQRRLVETWQASEPGWRRGQCKVCAQPMQAEPMSAFGFDLTATVCEECGPMVTAHYAPAKDAVAVTQTPWWDEYCPTVYREMIEQQKWPDVVDRAALKEVAAWGPSMQTGLCLYGPSGTGKTAALWGKARQLERTGSKPVMLSAVEFARKLATAARDLEKAEWLMQCGVLIVDDLGKEKLSAAVAPLIWEVIDERNNRRRPTLISSRFTGADFVARFTDQVLGEDIRGRIADCSRVIHFRAPGAAPALRRVA